MSILWKYLDKTNATIAALKDFSSMRFIIENTEKRIKQEKIRMEGLASPNMDGMPHAHNPHAGEERVVSAIEEIDILKERYRQAVEYMNWFLPAWKQLTDDEQYILETFYDAEAASSGAVYTICDHFSIERSSAYNRKNRALQHLTVLLFGKE